MKTLLLSANDVARALSIKDLIPTIEDGYIAHWRGQVQQPDIVSVEVPQHHGETDVKACYNGCNELISVKVVSSFFQNGKNGLPTMMGTILLLDGLTGYPLCIMDGGLITGIRTGVAGAISAKLLARKNSQTVAVLGGGGQARAQIYALCQVMDIQTVQVFSPYPAELPQYKIDVEQRTGVTVLCCDTVSEAMKHADIAISTTPSHEFLVDQSLVKPGLHIIAVGADMPGKNEWDPKIFTHAKIVNDSIAQCVSRGETRNAIVQGLISEQDIHGEIGALLHG